MKISQPMSSDIAKSSGRFSSLSEMRMACPMIYNTASTRAAIVTKTIVRAGRVEALERISDGKRGGVQQQLRRQSVGQFDVVFFLGVLYHLPDPVGSFLKIASVARQDIIVETHVDMIEHRVPTIAFYPFDECANDFTNWCGPNQAAVEGMLRLAGFKTIKSFPMTPAPYPVFGRKPHQYGRMVFHASR